MRYVILLFDEKPEFVYCVDRFGSNTVVPTNSVGRERWSLKRVLYFDSAYFVLFKKKNRVPRV